MRKCMVVLTLVMALVVSSSIGIVFGADDFPIDRRLPVETSEGS